MDNVDLQNDLALWRGWAVFEAIAAKGTVLFHWEDHYARLIRSCVEARIPMSPLWLNKDFLKKPIIKKIEFRGQKESLVKILVTRGDSINHKNPISETSKILIEILPWPKVLDRPLKLEVQNGIRELPRIKLAGGYGYTMIRAEIAASHGCDDFLFSSPETGITESSVGNIFFIWSGEWGPILYTPGDRILEGVTRSVVLDIARKSNLFYRVEDSMPACYSSDVSQYAGSGEVFITSTTRGVHPVGSIIDLKDIEHKFKTGPGTVTEKLKKLLGEYREKYFTENTPR